MKTRKDLQIRFYSIADGKVLCAWRAYLSEERDKMVPWGKPDVPEHRFAHNVMFHKLEYPTFEHLKGSARFDGEVCFIRHNRVQDETPGKVYVEAIAWHEHRAWEASHESSLGRMDIWAYEAAVKGLVRL